VYRGQDTQRVNDEGLTQEDRASAIDPIASFGLGEVDFLENPSDGATWVLFEQVAEYAGSAQKHLGATLGVHEWVGSAFAGSNGVRNASGSRGGQFAWVGFEPDFSE
jgi:hypothetical protein